MATFDSIDGAEPSTVTFRLATVTQDRGGQTQHQEIVTLGGTESTLAVAAVLAAAPASTAWALAVRIADPSTGAFAISSIAGPVTVRSSAANALVSVYQSTAADLNVTVAGYSTTVNISSLAGPVIVRSSAANHLVTVYQSTATELAATVHGNQSSNSSVYLPVRLTNGTAFLTASADYADGSTASNIAGPTVLFDNGSNATMRAVSLTNGLPVNVVAGAAGGSTLITVRQSTVGDLRAAVYQSTAADLNVTVAGYSTTVNVSSLGGVVVTQANSSGATRWFPVQISDGSTWVSDSTNRAIRVNVVAGSAAGDTTVSVTPASSGATRWFPVQLSDGSTFVSDSTNRAIRVNVVAGAAGGSTEVTVRQSTVGDLRAAVYQSTAADLNVTVAGYSTTVNISSLAGPVIVRSSAANALMTVYQSTAADLNVTVAGYSTTVNVSSGVVRAQAYTSSGGAVEGSTVVPAANAIGLHVRQVMPTMNSTTIVVTSTHSTAIYSLISSVAGLAHHVFAYFVGSTHTNPSTLIFCSSASASGFDHWAVNFGSGSSGITGANLAVAPPGFIFQGIAQNALNVKVEGGSSATSTCIVRVAVSWYDEA